jgi:hypothetical protein
MVIILLINVNIVSILVLLAYILPLIVQIVLVHYNFLGILSIINVWHIALSDTFLKILMICPSAKIVIQLVLLVAGQQIRIAQAVNLAFLKI